MVMHKREKTRELQSRFKWLLDFLNCDIDSLHQAEFLKLYIDLAVFIYGRSTPDFLLPKINLKTQNDVIREKGFLKKCQDYLRQELEIILLKEKELRQDQDRLEAGVLVKPYEVAAINIVNTIQVFYDVWVIRDKVGTGPIFLPGILNIPKKKLPKTLRGDRHIEHLVATQLLWGLIGTISPFLLSRIKTCQKCGNYFYQKTTRSKGDFCSSPKCRNYAATNRWRKNHPDEWKTYMRTYQRDRRDNVRQEQVEVRCPSCGFGESRGLLVGYLKSYSGPEECPHCKKTKLWHIVRRWDKEERDWVREPYDEKEWNRFLRGIQKGEG